MHIIGASGHAKVIIDTIQDCGQKVTGIWDDRDDLKELWNIDLKGKVADFKDLNGDGLVLAIGNNVIRKKIACSLQGAKFNQVIHSSSVRSKRINLGEGTVIMANATVNADTEIGNHVIINTNASIDHDCKIGDFVHISPNVALAGNVIIGEGSQIGIGASVIQGIIIGKWSTVGAGAVIIRDVPDYAVVVGNPGKIVKYNKI